MKLDSPVTVPAGRRAEHARPARLRYALGDGLRECWDRLGTVVAVSLCWSALFALTCTAATLTAARLHLALRIVPYAVLPAVALSAPTAGAFHVAHLALSHEEVGWLDMWRGAVRFAGAATQLGLSGAIVVALALVGLWFYLQIGGSAGAAAAMICFYLLVACGVIGVYVWPALVSQECGVFDDPGRRARRGAFAAVRRSFFLAIGSPMYSLGALAVLMCGTLAALASGLGFALLWMGGGAMLASACTRALLVQHGIIAMPAEERVVPDHEFRIAKG